MLTLRRHEKDFFLRKDLQYVDKFKAEFKAFIAELGNSPRSQAIKEKLVQYESNFNDIVKVEEAIGFTESTGLMGEMRATVHKIEPLLVKLEKAVEVGTKEVTFQTTIMFAIVFLVELILGLALAIIFSNRLTRTILTIREATVKLSEGIIPAPLAIKGNDELADTQRSVNDLISSLNDSVAVANLVARGKLYSAQRRSVG